ncbi:hypothetical protein GOP47_0030695 [Adiantum capillus-veneris]|nr:hypothetical protein GOP47_0030695 [Adiantum capillus-veneris]
MRPGWVGNGTVGTLAGVTSATMLQGSCSQVVEGLREGGNAQTCLRVIVGEQKRGRQQKRDTKRPILGGGKRQRKKESEWVVGVGKRDPLHGHQEDVARMPA